MANINEILSNLNSKYEEITSLVPNIFYFTDDFSRFIGESEDADDDILSIGVQSDGKYIIAGNDAFGVKRYNSNGTVDNTFNVLFDSFNQVNRIIIQSDAKIILIGEFGINSGYNIVRLNSDGSVDESLNVGTGFDSSVADGFLTSDESKLIVRTYSSTYNSNSVAGIVSIETSDGSLTTDFQTNIASELSGNVNRLLVNSNNDIFVEIDSTIIKKFDTTGTLDAGYSCSVSADCYFLLAQSNKIIRASSDGLITRRNSDGSFDDTFATPQLENCNNSYNVNYMLLDNENNIIVGGQFCGVNGNSYHKLFKIDSNGNLLNFNDPFDFEEQVLCLALTGDSILVGGRFNKPGRKLVKLSSTGSLISGYSMPRTLLYIGIDDGGEDIEDGGNFMDTDLTQLYSEIIAGNDNYDLSIPHTHTTANNDQSDDPEDPFGYAYKPTVRDGVAVDGTNYFGSGSSYFTNMYPGMYVMAATNVSVNEFSVTGNSGTDGNGEVSVYSFELTKNGTKYSCFLRSVHGDDPSNNGLIIVKGSLSDFTYQYENSSERDDNSVSGLSGITDVIYYMMICRGSESGGEGSAGDPFTNEMAEQVASKFLDIISCGAVYELDLSPDNPEAFPNYKYDGEGNMDTSIVIDPITGKRRSIQRTGYLELVDSCGNRRVISAADGSQISNVPQTLAENLSSILKQS